MGIAPTKKVFQSNRGKNVPGNFFRKENSRPSLKISTCQLSNYPSLINHDLDRKVSDLFWFAGPLFDRNWHPTSALAVCQLAGQGGGGRRRKRR
ncbi:hypothetical protein NPIL_170831 [Nephila pilipes]|uniref:Uncharacterized protein n=1 Tax=Nephila pilipes TaxID=299642 RepID=A0A8X6PYG6_NEPPI|nr:hypothetical protein NPIL_170831 [Nephila pilipes]